MLPKIFNNFPRQPFLQQMLSYPPKVFEPTEDPMQMCTAAEGVFPLCSEEANGMLVQLLA